MTDLPVFPQGADDPDGGGYKGRRADQDAASADPSVSVAPDRLGGVASPAAAPGPPLDAVGQQAAFGSIHSPAGPTGGPVHNPVGPAGGAGQVGAAGQASPVGQGAAGVGSADGPEYALGAVYAPGVGAPAGATAMPADPSVPAGYASPTDSNHTSLAAAGDLPAPAGGSIPVAQPAPVIAQTVSTGAPNAAETADGVSFHPVNLDAVLSGQPVGQPMAPPAGQPLPPPADQPPGQPGVPTPPGAPSGGTGGAIGGGGSGEGSGQDIQVSVDGAVVSSGDRGVQVNVGADGTTQVLLDPAQATGAPGVPGGPIGPNRPDHDQQLQPGQPTQPAHPGGERQPGPTGGEESDGRFIHGEGADPANVELTVDRATLGDVPVQVVRNTDGSLDVRVPAGADGHDVDVHVPPGRDADITLSRDPNGDLLVRATPDTGADNRTGRGPGDATDPTDPTDLTDPVAGDDTNRHDPATPADRAKPEDVGGRPGPPGGSAPGGGPPGGASPTSTTGSPPGGGPTGGGAPGGGATSGGSGSGVVKADPQAITKLGSDLTNHAGPMLDAAHQKAGSISVGFPGFGVLGLPLNMAHDQVRQTAQSYLAAGRNQLDSWRSALNQTATNYRNAEDSSTIADG